jgi:hypothetical protein
MNKSSSSSSSSSHEPVLGNKSIIEVGQNWTVLVIGDSAVGERGVENE